MYKRAGIYVVVFVAAVAFWVSAQLWIVNPTFSFRDFHSWLTPLAALVAVSGVLGVTFMLLQEYLLCLSASALTVLPFIVLFGFRAADLGMAAVLIILHASAITSIRDEMKNRIKLDAQRTVRRGIFMTMLPFLMLVSVAYWQALEAKGTTNSFKIPDAIERAIVEGATMFAPAELSQLPVSQRNALMEEAAKQIIREMTALAKPYLEYLPPLFAFGLFLTLEGISPIFSWLASLLAVGLLYLLKSTGFVQVEERQVTAETLVL